MAVLFNINDLFAIDSSGAMEISGGAGAATYVLMSNGAGNANSWYDVQSKFGEYLPLTGGTLTGNLAINGTNSLSVGGVTTLNDLDVTDTLAWRVSPTDVARQRADARDDATNFARLHWFGKSDNASTSNFRHAYYDGANYINVTAASGAVTFDGILAATGGNSTEWNTSYDNSITALAVTGTTTKTLTATQQDGGTLTASWTDNNTGTVTSSATASYIPYMSTATNVANSQLLYDTASSRTILTSTVGPNDDIRGSFVVRDDTAMAANVGGQIALGYKYLSSGGYTEGALIRTYKLNATSGDYSSGLKIQVRNTGVGLSTKFTLDPSGNVTIPGIYNATGGTSTEWNTAYDNSITGLAVTGTTTKTLTATQQDGGTLTASWTDNDSNTSWPNVGAGIRTNYTLGFKPPANGYAGFYFQTSDAAGAGYLLIRGESGSGAYTDQGISLIADAGWLSLVSRTTTDKGVRIMAGATATTRLTVTSAGHTTVTGIFGAPSSSGSTSEGILRLSQSSGVGSMYMGFGDPYAWIQSRSSSDYSSNYSLALNPNGGNVGIGTDSPTYNLVVSNGGASGVEFAIATATGLNEILSYNRSTSVFEKLRTQASQFEWYTDATANALVIQSGGNVGIGTIPFAASLTPQTVLDIGNAASVWGYQNYTYLIANAYYNTGWLYKNTASAGVLQIAGDELSFRHAPSGTADTTVTYTQPFTIKASGNVGIGTTSPDALLELEKNPGTAALGPVLLLNNSAGTIGDQGAIIFSSAGNAYQRAKIQFTVESNPHASDIQFYTGRSDLGTLTSKMTILGNGNVGIGTDSPSATTKLHIRNATSNSYATLRLEGSNRGGIIQMYNQTSYPVSSIQTDQSGNTYFSTSGAFASTTLSAKMTILTGGNVGIGTTSPERILHLDADQGRPIIQLDKGGDKIISMGTGSSATGADDTIFQMFNEGSELVRIFTEGNSWFNGGNVSIGSTSNGFRSERLYVSGEVRQESTVGLNPSGAIRGGLGAYDNTTGWGAGIGGQLVLGYIYTGSSYTEGALIKMYKQNSTQGHYGSGLRWAVRENGTNLTAKMDLSPSGTLTVIQDIVAYGSPSDKKLKENIKPISLALDKVTKLQGVTFDWKESDSMLNIKEDIGFIAQDVQKVVPELVRKNSNGLLSMRHQGVIPMLVEAIKELETRVKELENK